MATNKEMLHKAEAGEAVLGCRACGRVVDVEDAVWIDPSTTKATTGDNGAPYHVECAPEESES
jgi:hypothetical protein